MWKTVLFLIFTLIVVPFVAFHYDDLPTQSQHSTLTTLTYLYIASALLCFVVSTLSKNYSQVDKLWSILPIIYVWIACVDADYEPRILLMAILVTIWGLRLSYNFARRGGYQWRFWEGDEDYRWAILLAKPEFQPHWKWVIFNFFFICFYQLGLILLFTLPIVKCMDGRPLGIWDYVLAGTFVIAVIIEALADQQQWDYQNKKYKALKGEIEMTDDYKKGFLDKGLWGIVRHPNYAAEQLVWILFYLYTVSATGIWINWAITGSLLLIILFKGSSDFSEEISAGKYPEYNEYKKRVGRFIPWIS